MELFFRLEEGENMLTHSFFIVDNNKNIDYLSISQNSNRVDVSDDWILYFSDSMKWVKTKWNGKEENTSLNYYGTSIIDKDNLVKFVTIIEKWKDIFCEAPQTFELTGMYRMDCECYEKIIVEKKLLINTLDKLINLGKEAISNNCALLHMGI